MSLDAPLRPRPLSPHLAIYRLTSTLAQYLAEDGVKYDVVEHPFTVTALESAKASHISHSLGCSTIHSIGASTTLILIKSYASLFENCSNLPDACLGLNLLALRGAAIFVWIQASAGSADRSARLTS